MGKGQSISSPPWSVQCTRGLEKFEEIEKTAQTSCSYEMKMGKMCQVACKILIFDKISHWRWWRAQSELWNLLSSHAQVQVIRRNRKLTKTKRFPNPEVRVSEPIDVRRVINMSEMSTWPWIDKFPTCYKRWVDKTDIFAYSAQDHQTMFSCFCLNFLKKYMFAQIVVGGVELIDTCSHLGVNLNQEVSVSYALLWWES